MVLISAKRELPSIVLQNVLSVVSTLLVSLGPGLRILCECIFTYIYLKALHQLKNMLKLLEDTNNSTYDIITATPDKNNSMISYTNNGFSDEELGMIMESLCDIISNKGFITSIFASFDCEPTKPDIVKPLFDYLGECSRYT